MPIFRVKSVLNLHRPKKFTLTASAASVTIIRYAKMMVQNDIFFANYQNCVKLEWLFLPSITSPNNHANVQYHIYYVVDITIWIEFNTTVIWLLLYIKLEVPLLLIWQDVNFKSFKKEFSAKELEFFVSGLLECIFFSRPFSTFGFDKLCIWVKWIQNFKRI